jgi:predicted PurR-regulated permease PerM
MEGGYMLSNSGNIVLAVFMLLGGLFGMMLSFYLVLCFIQWLSDVVDEKRWLIWKEWLKW